MSGRKHAYHGLRQGETLVWTGTPCEYKDYGRADRVLLPVSAVALALSTFFAMFLFYSIARTGMRFGHLVSLAAVVLVGGLTVYAVFFRFAMKRRNKADFAYGVTNQGRVLICDHAEEHTYAFEPEELTHAAVTERDKHGTGTIYLKPKRARHALDNTGLEFLEPSADCPIALFDIPDCEKVYRLIKAGTVDHGASKAKP